jgi:MFS family permease
MTYARARLWLGICGVGTTVVLTAGIVIGQIPSLLLPNSDKWALVDGVALAGFVLGFVILMVPFDVLGGYLLPRWHGRGTQSFWSFARRWMLGVMVQSTLFVVTGLFILAGGRAAGLPGALGVIAATGIGYLVCQHFLANSVTGRIWQQGESPFEAGDSGLESWRMSKARIIVADHADPGFTGGVVGWPGLETVIVPRKWLTLLSAAELGVAIARRLQAVASGSRFRGLLLAFAWILCGFALSTLVPGGGVRSVAQLVTTCCAFTGWMFAGLLLLPTVSRMAAYAIDRRVVEQGIPAELLDSTLKKLDQLQDDEPARPAWVERIFHPVPSVDNRRRSTHINSFGAWHAARMMLFLSWSCLGLLSRAVHCNAGRPELWVMLPTD